METTTVEYHFSSHRITSGFGYEILKKWGWKEDNAGLGKNRDGIQDPIAAVKRHGRQCLGTPEKKESSCKKPRASWAIDIEDITYNRMQDWEWHASKQSKTFMNRAEHNPYAPCCKWDSSHLVPMRKLKDHEKRCPANPANADR